VILGKVIDQGEVVGVDPLLAVGEVEVLLIHGSREIDLDPSNVEGMVAMGVVEGMRIGKTIVGAIVSVLWTLGIREDQEEGQVEMIVVGARLLTIVICHLWHLVIINKTQVAILYNLHKHFQLNKPSECCLLLQDK
jgi:hypothetical protein